MIKKAMILAAGLGTRLRPLTHHCPKPLVPILNRPMIEHHLEQMAAIGIQEVAINLHYLPDQIQQHIGTGEKWGLKITYSLEEPVVLGTGGGIAKMQGFFEQEPMFLVINGDILHQIDLHAALAHHVATNAVATLMVRSHPGSPNIGSVSIDENGMIKRVPEMPSRDSLYKRMYTGMQILTPRIFEYLQDQPPPPSCILRTAYRKMLETDLPVAAFEVGDALWRDIGNPESYLSSQWELIDKTTTPALPDRSDVTFIPPVWLGKNITIAAQSTIGPYAVLGDNVTIRTSTQITKTVMWPNTEWNSSKPLQDAVVYSDQAGNEHVLWRKQLG